MAETLFNDLTLDELEQRAEDLSERLQSPAADLESEALLAESLPLILGLVALVEHHRSCTHELDVERERLKLVRAGQSAIHRLINWAGEKPGRAFVVENRVDDGWQVEVKTAHSSEGEDVDDAAAQALSEAAA